jgi:hypothetical protein
MRPHPCFVVALCAAAACSHDTTSASPPTPGTSTSSNGLNISIDSTFTNRTTVVATAIPAIVHVTLAGQPSAGVTVSWIVPAGGGSVSPASSTTDASGVATATWTMGDTARAYTLTAAITGASVTLQATATAGDPVTLSKVSADTIAVAAGASTLVTVRAVDKLGNPVSGVVVSWASTGGALTITATTTGASGNAEVAFSSDAAPRSYTITATAAGLGTATFIVVGR